MYFKADAKVLRALLAVEADNIPNRIGYRRFMNGYAPVSFRLADPTRGFLFS
jgi:hypothetical protein